MTIAGYFLVKNNGQQADTGLAQVELSQDKTIN
jgi:hypothetical protein